MKKKMKDAPVRGGFSAVVPMDVPANHKCTVPSVAEVIAVRGGGVGTVWTCHECAQRWGIHVKAGASGALYGVAKPSVGGKWQVMQSSTKPAAVRLCPWRLINRHKWVMETTLISKVIERCADCGLYRATYLGGITTTASEVSHL